MTPSVGMCYPSIQPQIKKFILVPLFCFICLSPENNSELENCKLLAVTLGHEERSGQSWQSIHCMA